MGGNSSTDEDTLSVATLNYSGILYSPYEFYEYKNEQESKLRKISQKFIQIAPRIMKEHGPEGFKDFSAKNFQWDIGEYDKKWQKKRYTPIYMPTCGIKNQQYLMDEGEFLAQWDQSFNKSKQQDQVDFEEILKNQFEKETNKKRSKYYSSGQQVPKNYNDKLKGTMKCRAFDLACYQSIVFVCYQKKKIDIKKVNEKADKYRTFQKTMFSKKFLNEEKKKQCILVQLLEKKEVDVLFLQETTQKLLEYIQQKSNKYRISFNRKKGQSAIVFRNDKFPKLRNFIEENGYFAMILKQKFHQNVKEMQNKEKKGYLEFFQKSFEQLKEKLDMNSDTIIQVIGNLIFICPHLTSNKDKNKIQVKQLQDLFHFLKHLFPDCNIICGGDLNGKVQITLELQEKNFNIFPRLNQGQMTFTSNKVRTMLQPQKNKANQFEDSTGTKDYLISDLQIFDQRRETIYGKDIDQNDLLPNENHPFDHYIVSGKVKLDPCPKEMKHFFEPQFLAKYAPQKMTKHQVQEYEQWLKKQTH